MHKSSMELSAFGKLWKKYTYKSSENGDEIDPTDCMDNILNKLE